MTKERLPPVRRRRRQRTSQYHVTVLGLGAVGRLVALQLAALGVRRLVLVDPGVITRRTRVTDGYAHDDVGRPKVHAAAQLCHQINPRLNIEAIARRSLRGVDLGDAVFCCPGTEQVQLTWPQSASGQVSFLARCRIGESVIHLDFTTDWDSLLRGRRAGRPAQSKPSATKRIPTATVAAGLLVAEFIRFTEALPRRRVIRLDADRLILVPR